MHAGYDAPLKDPCDRAAEKLMVCSIMNETALERAFNLAITL